MTRALWVATLTSIAIVGCSNDWQRYTWEEAGVSLAFPVPPPPK